MPMASMSRPLYPRLRAWPENSATALVGQKKTKLIEMLSPRVFQLPHYLGLQMSSVCIDKLIWDLIR
jgi:hypothetical protein